MDRLDKKLLQALNRNARTSNADLAASVGLTPTPCLRRLRRLERNGVIRSYRPNIDYEKLGFVITGLAFVKLQRNSVDNSEAFEQAVTHLPAITECCVVTGSHDYMLRIVARSLGEYERLLKRDLAAIDTVADIESSIILNQVDCSTDLPL
ncbi:MAG: Lrp/AsnC family transcriptional regulator [Pseudomonadota bacterium]